MDRQVAVQFVDLHDTPGRMKAKESSTKKSKLNKMESDLATQQTNIEVEISKMDKEILEKRENHRKFTEKIKKWKMNLTQK